MSLLAARPGILAVKDALAWQLERKALVQGLACPACARPGWSTGTHAGPKALDSPAPSLLSTSRAVPIQMIKGKTEAVAKEKQQGTSYGPAARSATNLPQQFRC